MVRKFFTFCMDSDWIEKNRARGFEARSAKYDPTLPFSDQEMERILWAQFHQDYSAAFCALGGDAPKSVAAPGSRINTGTAREFSPISIRPAHVNR
jgi:hypothetical protein